MDQKIKIGIIGEFHPERPSHISKILYQSILKPPSCANEWPAFFTSKLNSPYCTNFTFV